MALTSRRRATLAIGEARRRRVSALKLRGLALREIQRALGESPDPILNPDTGKPYSLATIFRDFRILKKRWMKESSRDTRIHQARQLAELTEHRKVSWDKHELPEVRLGIGLEMKLLGTPEPERHEVVSRAEIVIGFKGDLDRAYGEDDEHTEDAEGGGDSGLPKGSD